MQQSQTSTGYFLGDALGSVRQLVDENGSVTLTKSYEPYGELASSSGFSANTAYGYTNEYTSSSTNLLYLRARYYNFAINRFLTRDTWEGDETKPVTFNAWLYASSNPINRIDPSGHDFILANFENEFSTVDKIIIDEALWDVAGAHSRAYNAELRAYQDYLLMQHHCLDVSHYVETFGWVTTPFLAFTSIHDEKITFRKLNSDGWGEVSDFHTINIYRDGYFFQVGDFFNDGKITHGRINPVLTGSHAEKWAKYKRFITHEVGHAFDNATYVIGNQLGRNAVHKSRGTDHDVISDLTGFAGPRQDWQWRLARMDTHTEIFADMFVGWVYDQFEVDEESKLTEMGQRRYDFMKPRMRSWIFGIINERLGRR